MPIATLVLFSVFCGFVFFVAQIKLRNTHRKFSSGAKSDLFLILVFLPINFIIVFGPHFLLIFVEAWQEVNYGRVILLVAQIIAVVTLIITLKKGKYHAETT